MILALDDIWHPASQGLRHCSERIGPQGHRASCQRASRTRPDGARADLVAFGQRPAEAVAIDVQLAEHDRPGSAWLDISRHFSAGAATSTNRFYDWLVFCLGYSAISLGVCMVESGTLTTGAAQELLTVLRRSAPAVRGINARVGLSNRRLQDASSKIPLAAFTSMLEAAAYESGNTTLGIEIGKEFRLSALGPVSHLIRTATTLGDGLEKFIRFFGSFQTGTKTSLTVANGTARLTYAIADPAIRFRVQDAGLTLAVEYAMLSSLLGPSWSPTGIDFEHVVAEDLPFYRRHFSCPLRFGKSENAVMFPAHLLDNTLRDANPTLHLKLEADLADTMRLQAVTLDLVQSIEAWVASSLCRSATTEIESAARDFGMSLRTFQRKLADFDVNYFDVRNRVRSLIAACMLAETDVSITLIALQLGYSEASAFSRGFKIQVGETPMEYRKREILAA